MLMTEPIHTPPHLRPPRRVRLEPLEWYVGKLERGEPFASLLYGDGEFRVLFGEQEGHEFTNYRERVNRRLREELLDSFRDSQTDRLLRGYRGEIIRGTDPHLIDWTYYEGRDVDAMKAVGTRVDSVTEPYGVIDWVDGVVWDRSVREGQLNPFFRVLRHKDVMVIGHHKLCRALSRVEEFSGWKYVPIPPLDAWSSTDVIEEEVMNWTPPRSVPQTAYLVCAGLGAIPLIMRLAERRTEATFLDLGSVLDVFAGLGAERGWRDELYRDKDRWRRVLQANVGSDKVELPK